MKKLLIGISAGALALAGAAFAAEAHMEHGAPLTRAEVQAKAEAAFAKLDLNHDGKLDKTDRAVRISEMFDKLDTNHDGAISRDEFIAAHEKMGMGGMGGEHGDAPPPPGHEGGMMGHEDGMGHAGRMGHGPARMGVLMAILHEADPAHTGTVTKDAFVAAALKLFDQADTNHDGKLSGQERRAAWGAAMRKHMREGMGREGMEHGGMEHGGMARMGNMPPPPAK